jgi:hypothetical protein
VAEVLFEVLKDGLGLLVERCRLLNSHTRRDSVARVNFPAPALGPHRFRLLNGRRRCRYPLLQLRDLRLQLRYPGCRRFGCLVGLPAFRSQRRNELLQLLNLGS